MNKVKFYFKINFSNEKEINQSINPLSLWYALCLALRNESVIVKQLIHCKEAITKDFENVSPSDILTKIKMEKIEVFQLPIETSLDYKCLITCEEVDKIGGYKFKSHKSLSENSCNPIYVLSKEGYESLIKQENCFCPICYTSLSKDDFEEVGPKKNNNIEVFSKDFKNPFVNYQFINKSNLETKVEIKNEIKSETKNVIGTLIVMRGVVGAGKTTISTELQRQIEERNYYCINEGTDKYCKTGMNVKDACK